MIITCPNCNARYVLKAKALGEGRKVKCTTCAHVWYQDSTRTAVEPAKPEPQSEQTIEQTFAEDVTPPAVAPKKERPQIRKGDWQSWIPEEKPNVKFPIPAYSAAGIAGTFIGIFLILILIRDPLVSANPGLNSFYSGFGLAKNLPGEDLAFDHVGAEVFKSKRHIVIEGNIVNLSDAPRKIPVIEAFALDKNGIILEDPISYEIETKMIEAESYQSFAFIYPSIPKKLKDIELRLTLRSEAPHAENFIPEISSNTSTTIEQATENINPHRLTVIEDPDTHQPPSLHDVIDAPADSHYKESQHDQGEPHHDGH